MSALQLLLVEDEPGVRLALRGILRTYGFEVLEATTVAEGLSQLDAIPPPNVVLLDLMLPLGDHPQPGHFVHGGGLVILEAIRQRPAPPRVVVTTGMVEGATLDAVRALKPDAILTKPMELPVLLDAIRGAPAVPLSPSGMAAAFP